MIAFFLFDFSLFLLALFFRVTVWVLVTLFVIAVSAVAFVVAFLRHDATAAAPEGTT